MARPLRRIATWAVVVALLLAVTPPVRSRLKASLLVLDALPSGIRPLRLITPEPRRTETHIAGTAVDVYRPRGFSPAPGLVLVHGANPDGKDDARIRSLASSLASTGRRVVVPQLTLRHQRLDPFDRERIRAAVSLAAEETEAAVLAFSYGGGSRWCARR